LPQRSFSFFAGFIFIENTDIISEKEKMLKYNKKFFSILNSLSYPKKYAGNTDFSDKELYDEIICLLYC